jgi:hypothetical protein
MLGKPKLPFILSDANRLDREFYSGYDAHFLHRKVKLLGAVLENPDLLAQFTDGQDGPDEAERTRHAIAAEILFAEFHQFESFFAMLVAPFQGFPHWIFLNTYSTGEIKSKARDFIDGKFEKLFKGLPSDRDTFLRQAVYQGYASEAGSEEAWNSSFENLWWIIHRMAQKYVAADEYNSYKHGLRMMSATSALGISSSPTDFSNAFVAHSKHSITHLKFEPGDCGTLVSIATKAFNPQESQAHVQIMASILENIQRIRLAVLAGQPQVQVSLFSKFDRDALQRLFVCNEWALSA